MEIVRLLQLHEDQAICTLLHLNSQTSLLFDCGLCTKIDTLKLQKVLNEVASVDIILLSHASLQFVGALPILQKSGALQNKIILATAPVAKLGEMMACELYLRAHETPFAQDFKDLFEKYEIKLEDISRAYSKISPCLKFDEIYELSLDHSLKQKVESFLNPPEDRQNEFVHSINNLLTLKFCARPSGYSMGGTIWQIEIGGKEIIYAPRLCLTRSLALIDGSKIGSTESQSSQNSKPPFLLLLDGTPFSYTPQQNAKIEFAPEILRKHICDTVSNGGDVLLPTSGCLSEALDIALWLSSLISDNEQRGKQLLKAGARAYFISELSQFLFHYVGGNLEWLAGHLAQTYAIKENPLDFKNVYRLRSINELQRFRDSRKIIIAPDTSLEHGPARHLIPSFLQNGLNEVLLTSQPRRRCLAQHLLKNPYSTLFMPRYLPSLNNDKDHKHKFKHHEPKRQIAEESKGNKDKRLRELTTQMTADYTNLLIKFTNASIEQGGELFEIQENETHSQYGQLMSDKLRKKIEERAIDELSDEDIDNQEEENQKLEGLAQALNLHKRLARAVEFKKTQDQEVRVRATVKDYILPRLIDPFSLILLLNKIRPQFIEFINVSKEVSIEAFSKLKSHQESQLISMEGSEVKIMQNLKARLIQENCEYKSIPSNGIYTELRLFSGSAQMNYWGAQAQSTPLIPLIENTPSKAEVAQTEQQIIVSKNEENFLRFLEKQLRDNGIHASLIANQLNYDNKVFIRYETINDKREIRIQGLICPEYYLARKIVYASTLFV